MFYGVPSIKGPGLSGRRGRVIKVEKVGLHAHDWLGEGNLLVWWRARDLKSAKGVRTCKKDNARQRESMYKGFAVCLGDHNKARVAGVWD